MPREKQPSAKYILLRALIPYSKDNLKLSFRPNQFFNRLEKASGYSHKTFQNAAWEAEKEGLIRREDRLIAITEKGKKKLQPFAAVKLGKKAKLMIIFDVPEKRSADRQRLRLLLREWHFTQAQKSVWITDYDYRKPLLKAVDELALGSCVQLFECAKLYPKR